MARASPKAIARDAVVAVALHWLDAEPVYFFTLLHTRRRGGDGSGSRSVAVAEPSRRRTPVCHRAMLATFLILFILSSRLTGFSCALLSKLTMNLKSIETVVCFLVPGDIAWIIFFCIFFVLFLLHLLRDFGYHSKLRIWGLSRVCPRVRSLA